MGIENEKGPAGDAAPVADGDIEAKLIAAFDEGVAADPEASAELAKDEGEEAAKPEADPAKAGGDDQGDGEDDGDDGKDGDADPEKPKGEAKPEGEGEGEGGEPKDEAVEKEISELKLGERAAARFRDLTARIKELDGLAQQLEPEAARAREWDDAVARTGAKPEQFGAVMGYLTAINTGGKEQKMQAGKALAAEIQWLAKDLGVNVQDLLDPLVDHEDLRRRVKTGDLSAEDAAELARARAELAAREHATQTQAQMEQARTRALDEVKALGDMLRAADPQFKRKYELIAPVLQSLENAHPSTWVETVRKAYLAVKLPAAAPPPPAARPASASPLRPGGTGAGAPSAGAKRVPKDDFEALSMGIDEA